MLFLPREQGQGLVEYAMILIMIAIIVMGALLVLGPQLGNMFSSIVANL
jgi:pilus assembly protein Flp/PilA